MLELTHICDRCGARHTGEHPPLGWQKNMQLYFTAPGLLSYSPYHVDMIAELMCDLCASRISTKIKEVWDANGA